jgi:hypothetical protein
MLPQKLGEEERRRGGEGKGRDRKERRAHVL